MEHENFTYATLETTMQVYNPRTPLTDITVPAGTVCRIAALSYDGLDLLTRDGILLEVTYDDCSPMDDLDAAEYSGYDAR